MPVFPFFCAGISLVDESVPATNSPKVEIAPGIHAAYDVPEEPTGKIQQSDEQVDTSISLEELMAKMKSI